MVSFFGRGKSEQAQDAPAVEKTSKVYLTPPPDYHLQEPPATHADDEENVAALHKFLDEHRAKHPPAADYAPFEKIWASDEDMYRRYMRAAKGDMRNAQKRVIVRRG